MKAEDKKSWAIFILVMLVLCFGAYKLHEHIDPVYDWDVEDYCVDKGYVGSVGTTYKNYCYNNDGEKAEVDLVNVQIWKKLK